MCIIFEFLDKSRYIVFGYVYRGFLTTISGVADVDKLHAERFVIETVQKKFKVWIALYCDGDKIDVLRGRFRVLFKPIHSLLYTVRKPLTMNAPFIAWRRWKLTPTLIGRAIGLCTCGAPN